MSIGEPDSPFVVRPEAPTGVPDNESEPERQAEGQGQSSFPAQEVQSQKNAPAEQAATRKAMQRPLFWTRNEIRKQPVASFLVADLIPKGSVGQLVGRSGDCKSFGAQTLASRISEGRDFCGRKTKQCPCFYFNLEGGSFLPKRLLADDKWREEKGWPEHSGELYFWTEPFSLTSKNNVKDAIAFIRAHSTNGAFIVIDTQAQATAGVKESAFEDMSLVLASARKLAKAVNGTVCLVHHMGKDTSRGGRGSSAQRADVDFLIEVERNENIITWHTDKEREADDKQKFRFKLKIYPNIVQDEDGEWQSSCVAVPETDLSEEERDEFQDINTEKSNKKKLKNSIIFALKVFNDAINKNGKEGFISIAKYREAFIERYEPANPDPKKAASSAKTAFSRAVQDLQIQGFILKKGDMLKNLQP